MATQAFGMVTLNPPAIPCLCKQSTIRRRDEESFLTGRRFSGQICRPRALCKPVSAQLTNPGTQRRRELVRETEAGEEGSSGLNQHPSDGILHSSSGKSATDVPQKAARGHPQFRHILHTRAQVDWQVIKLLTEQIAQGINQTTLAGLEWWLRRVVEAGLHSRELERLVNHSSRTGYTLLHCAANKDGRASLVPLLAQLGARLEAQDSLGWTPLHYAATGNVGAVRALLAVGAQVDSQGPDGNTPLMLAVAHHDLETAEELVRGGANAGRENLEGFSAAGLACSQGVPGVHMLELVLRERGVSADALLGVAISNRAADKVRVLLQHGADPVSAPCFIPNQNQESEGLSREKTTPLHAAAYEGDVDVAAALLEFKADVGVRDSQGAAPLLLAVKRDHLSLARVLLQAGADTAAENAFGSSPITAAYGSGSIGMLELLLSEGRANPMAPYGENSLLGHAVANNRLQRARLLLRYGADPNSPAVWLTRKSSVNEQGERVWGQGVLEQTTLLHVAVLEGNAKMVAALVSRGADTGERALDGSTPLIYAVCRNNIKVVRELLRRGADREAVDEENNTPAMVACRRGQAAMLDCLLRGGASKNARMGGPQGPTLLQVAVGKLDLRLVRTLLKHGADPNAAGPHTTPPLRRALISMDQTTEMVAAAAPQLMKLGASEDTVLKAVFDANHCRFREAEEVPLVPKADTRIRETVEKAAEIVKLLIAAGADLFDRDSQGYTLIHNAVCLRRDSSASILKVLLESGAPGVNAFDKSMRTPLHLAAGDRNLEACRLLLQHGASLHAREAAGMSPLDFAASVGHTHIVEYFRTTPNGWLP